MSRYRMSPATGTVYREDRLPREPGVGWIPVVVIDPEDREQVERLRDAYDRAFIEQNPEVSETPEWKGRRGNALQAALREFAKPATPKPEEPTGVGAVVEDADGEKWVRVHAILADEALRDDEARWAPPRWVSDVKGWRFYADIDAVRVLSEGVTE